MNKVSTKINALLCATVIAFAPICAVENGPVVDISQQQDVAYVQDPVVWYEKRSTHVVTALAVTAVGLYALAVHKKKIAGPVALFMALFYAPKNVAEINDAHNAKSDDQKNDSIIKDEQVSEQQDKEKELLVSSSIEEQNQSATNNAQENMPAVQKSLAQENEVKNLGFGDQVKVLLGELKGNLPTFNSDKFFRYNGNDEILINQYN